MSRALPLIEVDAGSQPSPQGLRPTGRTACEASNKQIEATVGAFQGHLRLTAAAREDGRTFLSQQSFRAPFSISKPYWDGHALHLQVINPTAGILAGDELEFDVTASAGATLRVSTPSATRAFMMTRDGAHCRQRFSVQADASLEYAPEPLVPHRESNYAQQTRIDLAIGSNLFFTDILAPGRVAHGESWAWRRLRLTTTVLLEGEPLLREALDASGAEMERAARFHGTPSGWFFTAIVASPRLPSDAALWNHLRSRHRDGTRIGVSRLRREGWIIRAILPDGQAARDLRHELRSMLAAHLPGLRGEIRTL